jgi:hypothetical protein
MKELLDMTEAHLSNVNQQIENLRTQKDQIEDEIDNLIEYLHKGVEILDSHRTELQEKASSVEDSP